MIGLIAFPYVDMCERITIKLSNPTKQRKRSFLLSQVTMVINRKLIHSRMQITALVANNPINKMTTVFGAILAGYVMSETAGETTI
jgi:hypothetical protein